MYIVKNDSTFLNHIVIAIIGAVFLVGNASNLLSSGQQMKKHFLKCHSIKDTHRQMN